MSPRSQPGRIGYLGNVCNLFFDLASRSRDRGVDAQLFAVDRFEQENPFAANRLAPGSADWIHLRPYGGQLDTQTRPSPAQLAALARCDSLHGQGPWLTWALAADRPYVWQPYGADFYALPFARWRLSQPLARTTPRLLAANLASGLMETIIARRFRAAVRGAAHVVIIGWFDRHWLNGYRHLEALGKLDTVRTLPFPIDTRVFSPAPRDGRWPTPELQARLEQFDLVTFYPSRQLFTREGKLLDGMTANDPGKRNDVFYRALARARQQGLNVGAVIVDKANPDTPLAKRMIADLGLQSAVIWIPAMPRLALIDWYRSADLVVDCFGGGAPGSITFEAMACGTPVMQWIDYDAGRDWGLGGERFYAGELPVLNCRDEDEIVAALLTHPRRDLHARGAAACQWVRQHADIEIGVGRLLELHESLR
jgi:glycosyltransferase involved in cell wall biosynthesis